MVVRLLDRAQSPVINHQSIFVVFEIDHVHSKITNVMCWTLDSSTPHLLCCGV